MDHTAPPSDTASPPRGERAIKALVVHYSRTGHTRMIAARIADELGADREVIVDHVGRKGPLGWLRCGYEGSRGVLTAIDPPLHAPGGYDVVVVGGPVWSGAVSSPVRSYLRAQRDALPAVAFFCTMGGRGSERLFAQMTEACGTRPLETLALREDELARAGDAVARFAAAVRARATEAAGAHRVRGATRPAQWTR